MFFLTLKNVNIKFAKKKLIWKSYTTAKTLLTTKRIELINKKEFTKATLNENIKTFVVNITFLLIKVIHSTKETRIILLLAKKEKIAIRYLDFSDIFFEKKALI